MQTEIESLSEKLKNQENTFNETIEEHATTIDE
jgi:hypothetical protein